MFAKWSPTVILMFMTTSHQSPRNIADQPTLSSSVSTVTSILVLKENNFSLSGVKRTRADFLNCSFIAVIVSVHS